MAGFVKKTWGCGLVLTIEDMNRIENGIDMAQGCVIRYDHESSGRTYFDKTWLDVQTVMSKGGACYVQYDTTPVTYASIVQIKENRAYAINYSEANDTISVNVLKSDSNSGYLYSTGGSQTQ